MVVESNAMRLFRLLQPTGWLHLSINVQFIIEVRLIILKYIIAQLVECTCDFYQFDKVNALSFCWPSRYSYLCFVCILLNHH